MSSTARAAPVKLDEIVIITVHGTGYQLLL